MLIREEELVSRRSTCSSRSRSRPRPRGGRLGDSSNGCLIASCFGWEGKGDALISYGSDRLTAAGFLSGVVSGCILVTLFIVEPDRIQHIKVR